MREWRKHQLAITLYEHGHSARDVGELLDMSTHEVSKIVERVGVSRSRKEAAQLTKRREVERVRLQQVTLLLDVAEDLAAKIGIPAELLLDVLVYRLAMRLAPTPEPAAKPEVKTVSKPRRGRDTPKCVSECDLGCTQRCAKTTGSSDNARPPGSLPASKAPQGQRAGVPYVRTGLSFPEPGPRSRWGS